MYGITRTQHRPGSWSWTVHVKRRGNLIYARFYDIKYGGMTAAKAAAIAWRDAMLARTRLLSQREFNQIKRSNNTSGVPGVVFLRPRDTPGGVWQAKTKLPDGRFVTKNFAVLKFGEREAFRRAVAAREQMLAMIGDQPYPHCREAHTLQARQASPKRR